MTEYALRLENSTDTAPRVRAGDAFHVLGTTAVRGRGGLRPDGGGVVSIVAGTMDAQVTAFSCWVDATPTGQVGYPFVCDATKTLTLSPGHATLVRVDTIAVVVRENAFDGSGATTATLEVVEGTPGAGAPAMPAAAIPLRDVNVPAGASVGTGGLTSGDLGSDRRVYTVASGGVLPVASVTERDAVGAKEGQVVYRKDTDTLEVFDGAAWNIYSPDAGAWASYTPTWTAVTTNPTIGNGSLTGHFLQRSKRVECQFILTLGSTTNRGGGVWSFTLPVPPRDIAAVVGDAVISNAGLMVPASCHGNTGSTIRASRYDGTLLAHNGPVAWATGDAVRFSVSYEAA